MKLVLFVFLFGLRSAHAFPEMVRHGYNNCNACHVSPAGGGVLNSYGRELSKELLSTWGYKNEQNFLHGILDQTTNPDVPATTEPDDSAPKFFTGGDVRLIQIHRETPKQRRGAFFPMQANLEFAAAYKWFSGVAALGDIENPRSSRKFQPTVSPKFFVMLNPLPEFAVRVGRFAPVFGINIAEHQYYVRQNLGLAPYIKRDTLEAGWWGDQWNLVCAISTTTPDLENLPEREIAATVHITRVFKPNLKTGISYWKSTSAKSREILSAHGIFGFTHRLFTLLEVDFQNSLGTRSAFGLVKTGYELFQGYSPYAVYQHARDDFDLDTTQTDALGVGFQWLIRPHIELALQWSKVKPRSQAEFNDDAHLLIHYYF
jgi:hypothetical protein